MANILVTGANGQLGSELRKKGFSFLDEVFYTDKDELDITDYERVERFVKSREIDTIINCAAIRQSRRLKMNPDKRSF